MSTNGSQLEKHGVLMEPALWARVTARARAEDVAIATLVRRLLGEGLDAREAGPEGVGRTKADRLVAAIEDIREELRDHQALFAAIGRATIATQHLLVLWAGREASLGMSEEELFAELQAEGHEAWQQTLDEVHEETPPRPPGGDE